MHGRPREYKHKLRDPKAQESYKKKVDAIRAGTGLVLQCRQARRYDALVMEASAKLLKVVPEIYTIWNFRREALASVFEAGGEAAKKASDTELALTHACLLENPKSYSTWHHRKWVVLQGHANLDAELALVTKALDQDSRNFHAWNYRQFVVRRMGRPLQEELAYSEDKIAQNFSNYSAWHYRTILLHNIHIKGAEGHDTLSSLSTSQGAAGASGQGPAATTSHELDGSLSTTTTTSRGTGPGAAVQQYSSSTAGQQEDGAAPVSSSSAAACGSLSAVAAGAPASNAPDATGAFTGSATQAAPIPIEVLDEEYDMVHQAFATDSQDQSPWMYYRWLVGNSLAHVERAKGTAEEEGAGVVLEAVLAREAGRLECDHLSADPDAKWPLLTLARLKEAQARLGLCGGRSPEEVASEARAIYARLMELDPMRAGFYRDALEGRAFVVVSALGTV